MYNRSILCMMQPWYRNYNCNHGNCNLEMVSNYLIELQPDYCHDYCILSLYGKDIDVYLFVKVHTDNYANTSDHRFHFHQVHRFKA